MFSSILETDFADKLKEHAKNNRIKNDRTTEEYKSLFVDVENYVCKNKLIISDIDMLVDRKILYKEIYNIYCDNPSLHGNNLINMMASKRKNIGNNFSADDSKWLVLKTSIPDRLLSLSYKNKIFANIHSFAETRFKHINFNIMIKPLIQKGFYTECDIYLLPYEIELMDIYKKLYLPYSECVNIWKDLVELEPFLIDKTNERIKYSIMFDENRNSGGAIKASFSDTIKKIIIHKLLPQNDFILIGDWAIKLIEWGLKGGAFKQTSDRIQIISPLEIEETFDLIKSCMKTIMPVNPHEITYREHQLSMPKDLRIKRYTIYTQSPCNEEGKCPVTEIILMDVFINASYELVPWISSNRFLKKKNTDYPNVKIGNPYVLLRFFLLELWILRIIYSKGLSIKSIIQKKLDAIWISVNKIRNPKKLGGIINKSFSLENYTGQFYSEALYFKKIITDQRIPEYIPYQWEKKHHSYRAL